MKNEKLIIEAESKITELQQIIKKLKQPEFNAKLLLRTKI